MSYCIKCGRKLVDRYLENEGVIPYCENCKEYRFKMYNVAISMIVIAPNNKILLIKQYHKNDYILVAGYVNYQESIESALKRELKEETGIVYDANNLKELLLLEYYQLNYPTRRDEVINRLIRTKFYFGQYRGIDLKSINRTENEVKDNFHLDLIDLDEFASLINESSENSRKKYFDRENQEVIKVLKKVRN